MAGDPGAGRRMDRHARDRAGVCVRRRDARVADGPQPRAPEVHLDAVGLRGHRGSRREALDLRRPAVGVHGADRLRCLDDDPPVLGLVHEERRRGAPVLRVPQLLRVLDAPARARRELRAADRRLGVRRRRLVPADLVLVPAHDGHERGTEGVPDQRVRRRRPRARDVLHLPSHRQRRLHHDVQCRPSRVRAQLAGHRRRLSVAARGCVRQVRPGPAAHVAPGRDGGADASLLADPRRDDGDRRRLPDCPHASAV